MPDSPETAIRSAIDSAKAVKPDDDIVNIEPELGDDEAATSQAQTDPEGDGVDPDRKPTQRDLLVACAADTDLWHDADGDGFATVEVDGHHEHYAIRRKQFREWLSFVYYRRYDSAPSSQAKQDAIATIVAKAVYDGSEHPTAVRVGGHEGNIYIDLCDDRWRAIEITPAGWRIVDSPPVRFIRPPGMRPLPVPVTGGSIDALKNFINVADEADMRLVVGCAVMSLNPKGPYPILVFNGEQGAAKSTAQRVLRNLIDPSAADLRAPPKEERDLLVAARNSWTVSYDNLSRIQEWQADALCRIATGSGYSARQLYTDSDETIFEAQRPIIINGIPDLATRADLADRSVVIKLPKISKHERKPEKQFWAEFADEAGGILGVLLDAASTALRGVGGVQIKDLPRMADFAQWATAAESSFGWESGSFMAAYRHNLEVAIQLTIESDPVADAVTRFVNEKGEWSGTATELLVEITERAPDALARAKEWPKSPNALSNRLRRAAASLRETDIHVDDTRSGKARTWNLMTKEISKENDRHHRHHRHSADQAQEELLKDNGLSTAPPGAMSDDPCDDDDDPSKKTVTRGNGSKPLMQSDIPSSCDDDDDDDDDFPPQSASDYDEERI